MKTFLSHLKFLKILFLLFYCLQGINKLNAQTMMPLPAHSNVYTGSVRGYWFTAPTAFTITGLKVSPEAGTGTQSIHLMKINDPVPVVFSATSTNFTTLAYISNAPNNTIQSVNVQVNAGDIIGVLGQVAGVSNSYSANSPFSSTIGSYTVPLGRLLYQGNITSSAAPNYSTEPTSNQISRVEIYYMIGGAGTNNAGIPDLVAPVNFCASQQDVKVKVRNYGSNILNTLQVQWSMNGVMQTPVNITTPIDTPGSVAGNELTVTLGNYNFSSAAVNLKAWTTLPNGGVDTINSNDTLTTVLQSSLSGTYTINSGAPASATNYQNFTDFADDLNTYGVCGPVIANVVTGSGPYNERVNFDDIAGTSATNTIRINGNGETLQYNATATTNMQILTLDGTKYFTLNNLKVKALNAGYGWGVHIMGNAERDSIINCTIDLSAVTTNVSSVNANGIVVSGSATSATTGGTASHIFIGNNNVIAGSTLSGGAYYGIAVSGPSSTILTDSIAIVGNEISNFYYYGIRAAYIEGVNISGNDIHRSTKTVAPSAAYGIYNYYGKGGKVEGNKIHDMAAPGVTSTSSFYGMYNYPYTNTTATPMLVANNLIYNMGNYTGTQYLMYNNGPGMKIYHNTIDHSVVTTGTGTIYGMYNITQMTSGDIKNNNITITGGTTGAKYGIYQSTATVTGINYQKNNVYLNSTQTGTQVPYYYGSAYATLAAFQAAHPTMEIGSPSVNPQYTNPLLNNYTPLSASLIGSGFNVFLDVPADINGLPRTTAPTIGAFEVAPSGPNDAAMVMLHSPSGSLCATAVPVKVIVSNAGTNNLTSMKVNWKHNGVLQPQFSYSGNLSFPGSGVGQVMDTVTVGTVSLVSGANNFEFWTSLPNGVADINTNNDSLTIVFNSVNFTLNSSVDTVCPLGSTQLQLNPSSGISPSTITWQSSTNGGLTWTNIAGANGVTYIANGLSSTISYRAQIATGGTLPCTTPMKTIQVFNMVTPTGTGDERCGPGALNLNASVAGAGVLKWYDVPTGGAPLGTGSGFTTPVINTTTTYYVAAGGSASNGDSLEVPLSVGNTSGVYHHMFLVHSITGSTINEIGLKVNNTVGSSTGWSIYYRPDNYQLVAGANTSSSGWILAATTTNILSLGPTAYTTIANNLNITIPAGMTYSIYIAPDASSTHQYASTAMGTTSATSSSMQIIAGNRGSSLFNCTTSGGQAIVRIKTAAGCESNRIPIVATINPIPSVDLGDDLDTCTFNAIPMTLNPGTQPIGTSFVWDDNTTGSTRFVNQSGVYHVKVTNQFNCVNSDTINISMREKPAIDLALNGTSFCVGSSKVLDAGPGGENGGSYYWNTGEQTRYITVTAGGTYIVSVTSNNGCANGDTITIMETGYAPTADGVHTTAVSPTTFSFSVINPQNINTYQWDFGDGATGSGSNPSHTYSSNGIFLVKVKVSSTCADAWDSAYVNIIGVGVKDLSEKNTIHVFPNPNRNGVLNITLNNNDVKLKNLVLFNVLGQKLFEKEINANHGNNLKVNLPTYLPSGIYHLEIQTNLGNFLEKIELIR
ncbi:MAG TPA: PKD domain-containing protein [Edaphocola sp.]|nr:PKD domain-containing protein [Edaphocola sp.]